jgi:HK97 family phage prohead protease
MPDEIRASGSDDLRVEMQGIGKIIRGHAIVTNRLSEVLGFFRERIAPEALVRTLKEGVDLRALVDHNPSQILGRMTAGTLRVAQDPQGLVIEIDPPETTAGQDIVASIRRRDVTGMSFAFRTITDSWDESTDPPTRTVEDMLVREISVVTFPAYPQTDVAMRSLSVQRGELGLRRGRPLTVSERIAWSKLLTPSDRLR